MQVSEDGRSLWGEGWGLRFPRKIRYATLDPEGYLLVSLWRGKICPCSSLCRCPPSPRGFDTRNLSQVGINMPLPMDKWLPPKTFSGGKTSRK